MGPKEWVWGIWPRGFGERGTPDCVIKMSWSHWWWNSGHGIGQSLGWPAEVEEREGFQQRLWESFERARVVGEHETEERGWFFQGMVVGGWLAWTNMRPFLAGVEPVSAEVARWVIGVSQRGMVGPVSSAARIRTQEDDRLAAILPVDRYPTEPAQIRRERDQEGPRVGGAERRASSMGASVRTRRSVVPSEGTP